jgi:hypothetical protein
MIRTLQIDAVSYKTRALLSDGSWLEVPKTFELNNYRKDKTYTFELAQRLNGEWFIVSEVKED